MDCRETRHLPRAGKERGSARLVEKSSMADKGAEIIYTNGDALAVRENHRTIQAKVGGVTDPHIPLIELVDEDGTIVSVNAHHIREIRDEGEKKAYRSAGF